MPIFGSNVSLPIMVRIEESLLDKVNELLHESNLLFTRPLIIVMKQVRSMADRVSSGFKEPHVHEIEDNSYPNVEAVTTAPLRNLKAGVGDLLSDISATNDWLLAYRRTHEHYDTVAALLAHKSAFEMLDAKQVNFTDTSFLHILAEGLVLSGIAMGIAGTSRPSSGAEHLLSHAYDELYPDSQSLHGEQVAMFGVFTSLLQEAPPPRLRPSSSKLMVLSPPQTT